MSSQFTEPSGDVDAATANGHVGQPAIAVARSPEDDLERRQIELDVAKQSMKKLLAILLLIGVGVGALAAAGIGYALQRLNLTNPPTEEQQLFNRE